MTRRRTNRAPRRFWTAEEDATLRARYPDTPTAALALELGRTERAVYGRADALGLHKSAAYLASSLSGRLDGRRCTTSQFKPGHTPANKGLRRPGWAPGRMRETQFKPGERHGVAARRYQPIGAERMSADGYRERKVSDEAAFHRRWRAVHLLVWEAAHGPVPPGHAVRFKNGDPTDIRIENLECITRRDLMLRNSVHNLPAPLPQTIQLLGALNRKINRRTRAATPQATP